MESIGDQILRIPLIEKDEIEEGSKEDHSINIYQIFDGKFKNLNNSSIKSRTIFKANVWQRESNPDAYTPKMVSIGPYHNRKRQLHQMEEYKFLYLQQFLRRKEGVDVESCISELEKLKEKAINCYEDVEDHAQFCKMLLRDGCFVVQFIRQWHGILPEGEDEIFNNNTLGYIFRDLMLLENQLPFFILDKLHDITKRDDELPLATLLASELNSDPFFVKMSEMTFSSFVEITGGKFKHLLHLKHAISCHGMKKPKDGLPRPYETFIEAGGYYNIKNVLHLVCRYLGHAGNRMKKPNDYYYWYMVMPNATQLSEAGVRFEMHHGTSIFDIRFENGSMSIPQFRVTDDTEILMRNLIAYEQQSVDVQTKYFSDFVFFMDNLIKSDKDVTLLRRKGIIENWLRDDKEVAIFFNKIASEVPVSADFYYSEVFRKAVKYCENNRMRAAIVHYFFKNSLTGASTVVAFIALIFTCIQTILAYTGPIRK